MTHLWGQCADLQALRRICDAAGLFLVEDTAHVLGATWEGRPAGAYGDVAAWAFQGTKQLGLADAGMLTTDREDLYQRLTGERAYGMNAPPFTLDLRMNELTGAVGLGQVPRVEGYVAEYTRSLETLDEAIAGCPWLRRREVARGAQPGRLLVGGALGRATGRGSTWGASRRPAPRWTWGWTSGLTRPRPTTRRPSAGRPCTTAGSGRPAAGGQGKGASRASGCARWRRRCSPAW